MERPDATAGALTDDLGFSLGSDEPDHAERTPGSQEDHDWSWSKDRADIVIPEQPETAVHFNPQGQMVIRQDGWPDIDRDNIIIIAPENVPKLVIALMRLLEADQ